MKRDLITWTVYFLRAFFRFRFIARIQIQSCRGRFIITFLYLSTLPRSDFPGSHGAKKHYRLVFFWACALQNSYFFFYVFFHGVCKPCNEPETSGDKARKYHNMSLLFVFCIEHSFIYFLFSEFFPVIYLFWHTLTARDDTRTRQHTRQGRK